MFDFWYSLHPAGRAALGLLMMVAAVVMYLITDGGLITYGLGIVGLIFLLACRAGSDTGGYNF